MFSEVGLQGGVIFLLVESLASTLAALLAEQAVLKVRVAVVIS